VKTILTLVAAVSLALSGAGLPAAEAPPQSGRIVPLLDGGTLPPMLPGQKFIGAPEPKKTLDNTTASRGGVQTASKAEPVSAEEEKSRFTLSPGFEIELVRRNRTASANSSRWTGICRAACGA